MNLYTSTQVHRDHREWSDERAMWHDDVRVWEGEIDDLMAKIQRIEAALVEQRHNLQVHAASVRLYEEAGARSEHLLADCERHGNDERECVLAHAHEGEVQRQERQRERHEELKAAQRLLVIEVRPLARVGEYLPPVARRSNVR
jgi:hypothetical protein